MNELRAVWADRTDRVAADSGRRLTILGVKLILRRCRRGGCPKHPQVPGRIIGLVAGVNMCTVTAIGLPIGIQATRLPVSP